MTSKRYREADLDGNREKMTGRGSGSTKQQIEAIVRERRRATSKVRKDKSEVKRFGIPEDRVNVGLCNECGMEQEDVFQFLIENTGVGAKIVPERRSNVCPGCLDKLAIEGIEVRPVHTDLIINTSLIQREMVENMAARQRSRIGIDSNATSDVNPLVLLKNNLQKMGR